MKLPFDFQVKKKGNAITIEGYANAATVDRMKEKIEPEAWSLDNYKKNPIMLFDHGHDPVFGYMPVGKMVMVEPKEGGLYCKGQLSNSTSEKITAVRDLVEEGILKTFSVGFNAQDSKSDGDVNVITKAELIEVSIVPIPMNQDSTFSVLSKRFDSVANPTEKRWLGQFLERAKLTKKGAWLAAAVHQQVYNLQETGELKDKDAAMKYVAELAKVTPSELTKVLAGDVTPVPSEVIEALATVLKIDKDFLMQLNSGDVAVLDKLQRPEMKSFKTKALEDCTHSVMVAKVDAATAEEAAKKVSEAGYKTDKMSEDDVYYSFIQVEPGTCDEEAEGEMKEIDGGLMAYVLPLKAKEENTEAQAMYEQFLKESAEAVSGGEGNPPSWVADEDKWEKAKEMAKAAGAEDKYAFVTWAYLNILEGGKKSFKNMGAPDGAGAVDDNPYLAAARQQVAMLGQVIMELQKLSKQLEGLPKVAMEQAATEEPKKEDAQKSYIDRFLVDIDTKLKKLGC